MQRYILDLRIFFDLLRIPIIDIHTQYRMLRRRLMIFALLMTALCVLPSAAPKSNMVDFLMEYLTMKYDGEVFDEVIYVAAKRQRLYHIKNGEIVGRYVISTSKYGLGCKKNSEKTPLGLHTIYRKFGDDVPEAGIFKERRYTGKQATIISEPKDVDSDDITTRILWLSGKEPGVNAGHNVDSRSRAIYIHGTPEEGLIGQPASHGCIRMLNSEVIALYDAVPQGTPVVILNN